MTTWDDVITDGNDDEWIGAGEHLGFECTGCGACALKEGGEYEDDIVYVSGGYLDGKFLCHDCLVELLGRIQELSNKAGSQL